jgi:hypothetical protein
MGFRESRFSSSIIVRKKSGLSFHGASVSSFYHRISQGSLIKKAESIKNDAKDFDMGISLRIPWAMPQ